MANIQEQPPIPQSRLLRNKNEEKRIFIMDGKFISLILIFLF
jgi:hypothetical protein